MRLTGNFHKDLDIINDAAKVVYPDNKIMKELCNIINHR